MVNCNKSLTGSKQIDKQIEITDKFLTICKSEDFKSTDKKLEDITDIDAIKKIIGLN